MIDDYLPLFDQQTANLDRVRSKIGLAVLAFAKARLETQPEFVITELYKFVADGFSIAPASADRILRDLRQNGQLDYTIVNRRQSRYKVLSVGVQ